ncbi:16032_t:CDS:1, partial [Acaulospora morrowiae]
EMIDDNSMQLDCGNKTTNAPTPECNDNQTSPQTDTSITSQ